MKEHPQKVPTLGLIRELFRKPDGCKCLKVVARDRLIQIFMQRPDVLSRWAARGSPGLRVFGHREQDVF